MLFIAQIFILLLILRIRQVPELCMVPFESINYKEANTMCFGTVYHCFKIFVQVTIKFKFVNSSRQLKLAVVYQTLSPLMPSKSCYINCPTDTFYRQFQFIFCCRIERDYTRGRLDSSHTFYFMS